MYKRTFKALFVAAVLGVAFPVSAAAMPTDHSGGPVVVLKSTPAASPIVSEKTAGLNLSTQQPTESVTTSTSSFDWGDFGIGAAVMFGALLVAVATAGVVRRQHHAHLAH